MFRTVLEQTNETLFDALASPQKQHHSRNTLNSSGHPEKNNGPTASELALGSTQICLWKPSIRFSSIST